MTKQIQKGSTAAKDNLQFLMIDSSDHLSPKTGLTPTVTLSKAGGAFAAPSGAVTEIGNGWYSVAANATDNNTKGALLLHATATGADPADKEFVVVNFDPTETAIDQTDGAETGYTVRQLLRLAGAVLLGKRTHSGSTVTYRSADDSANRVVAVVSSGDRSSVTLTP